MRDEFDLRDHVPGGWRREALVTTVPWRSRRFRPWSRRGGCRGWSRAAIAGWAAADERGSSIGLGCRRRTTAEAGSIQSFSTAFRWVDGPARLGAFRDGAPFTTVWGRVGNGVRDTGYDWHRVPRGSTLRGRGDAAFRGRYLQLIRSCSRPSTDGGWPVSVTAAGPHTRLPSLVGMVQARTRLRRSDRHVVPCGRRISILATPAVPLTNLCWVSDCVES